MRFKHRQLIVGALGVVVIGAGISLRILLMGIPRKVLSLIGSFGRTSGAAMGTPTTDIPHQILSHLAMAFVYAGVLLMVAPVIAWLFLPTEKTKNEMDVAS